MKYGHCCKRKEHFRSEWNQRDEYKDAMIRSLDSGGLVGGERIALYAAIGGSEEDYYRTMHVTKSYIYGNGAMSFTGFVTNDEEEYSDEYHVEQWDIIDPNGEFA